MDDECNPSSNENGPTSMIDKKPVQVNMDDECNPSSNENGPTSMIHKKPVQVNMDDECNPSSNENGPTPMIDRKPVQKAENAADQFSNAHQAVYEAREKPSRDKIEEVQNHNQAHPALKDELDKRRSIVKITPENCSVSIPVIPCNKNDPEQRKYTKGRNNRDNNNLRRRGSRDNRRKTIVNRSRKLQKRGQKGRRNLSLGICYRCRRKAARNKNIRTENCHRPTNSLSLDHSNHVVDHISKTKELNRTEPKRESQSKFLENKDEVLSIGPSVYPDTSKQSFDSYHSYASMDDEPAVDT